MKRWWVIFIRLILGIIFIIAGVSKLSSYPEFINEVNAYHLLPQSLAYFYAILLPWLELAAGCALVLGIATRLVLILIILMTISFMVASIQALLQGTNESCGCFGHFIILNHTVSLIVNVVMLAIAVVILFSYKTMAYAGTSYLMSRLSSKIPFVTKPSGRYFLEVVVLITIVLAVGLPLSLDKPMTNVYSEIDSSLEREKPVFLFFYLDECKDCQRQKSIIEDLQQTYRSEISFISINFREESSIAGHFDVTRVPSMLLIDGRNDSTYLVVQRYSSFTSWDTLNQSFETIHNPSR